MKKNVLFGVLSLGLLLAVISCDNGNADFDVIDVDPTVELGAMNGLVEGETFTIDITLGDGAEGSSTSTLASGNWDISAGGTQSASGTLTPSGDNWTGTISASGLTAGNYTITVTATDSNGNTGTASGDITIAAAIPDITGTWMTESVPGALRVGPNPGAGDWWAIPAGDIVIRACYFDDTYTFNADGTFTIVMGADTWLEGWQGAGGNSCSAPAAPHDGSGSYTYSFNGTTLTVNGAGAFLGLPKVTNSGELGNHIAANAVPASISYNVFSVTDDGTNMRMEIRIETVAGVHWTYSLIKQ